MEHVVAHKTEHEPDTDPFDDPLDRKLWGLLFSVTVVAEDWASAAELTQRLDQWGMQRRWSVGMPYVDNRSKSVVVQFSGSNPRAFQAIASVLASIAWSD